MVRLRCEGSVCFSCVSVCIRCFSLLLFVVLVYLWKKGFMYVRGVGSAFQGLFVVVLLSYAGPWLSSVCCGSYVRFFMEGE